MPDDAPTDDGLADLADAIVELSHSLVPRSPELRGVVPLTGTEIAVIREVHRNPRTTPAAVAAATRLQRSNVSTAVRALEARGLLIREHPAGDGRSVELVPTPLAAENVGRLRAFWAERLRAAPPEVVARAAEAREVLAALAGALAAST